MPIVCVEPNGLSVVRFYRSRTRVMYSIRTRERAGIRDSARLFSRFSKNRRPRRKYTSTNRWPYNSSANVHQYSSILSGTSNWFIFRVRPNVVGTKNEPVSCYRTISPNNINVFPMKTTSFIFRINIKHISVTTRITVNTRDTAAASIMSRRTYFG